MNCKYWISVTEVVIYYIFVESVFWISIFEYGICVHFFITKQSVKIVQYEFSSNKNEKLFRSILKFLIQCKCSFTNFIFYFLNSLTYVLKSSPIP